MIDSNVKVVSGAIGIGSICLKSTDKKGTISVNEKTENMEYKTFEKMINAIFLLKGKM